MKKKSVAVFLFLVMFVLAAVSYGQNADNVKIRNLLNDLSSLKAAIAQEQKVREGFSADKKLLDAQDKTIKSLESQFNKDFPAYKQDAAAYDAEQRIFLAGKNAYIAKYGCWDCKGRIADQQTRNAQIAELSVLNPQNSRLNVEYKRLDAKHAELEKTAALIKEGKESLSKATLEWAAKWKASNAKMNELIAQYQKMTKIYMDLVQMARLSEECKQIAYSSDRNIVRDGVVIGRQSGVIDFNDLNGVMERAHHCLQKVWDGAK
jgi:hypothetical protein